MMILCYTVHMTLAQHPAAVRNVSFSNRRPVVQRRACSLRHSTSCLARRIAFVTKPWRHLCRKVASVLLHRTVARDDTCEHYTLRINASYCLAEAVERLSVANCPASVPFCLVDFCAKRRGLRDDYRHLYFCTTDRPNPLGLSRPSAIE